jgi:TRAP-type C4-dicarboxylate transport system permease large subunit
MGFLTQLPTSPSLDPLAAAVVLDRLQDAGHVGAILRSASAFGFKQVVALKGTAGISGMILFIILGATTFAQILSFSGASSGLVQFITGHGLSANQILIGMMLLLIFLGIFVDQVSMMMITLPIFMPIVNSLGIDPVWFGVLFLICMQLGLLLPPHGLLLMTMRGVAPPSVTMTHIFLAVTPYVVMSLLLLAAVFMVPGIATWLPGWMA